MPHWMVPILFWLAVLAACSPAPVDPLEGLPGLDGLEADPARLPSRPAVPPDTVAVRHILCSYRGALEAYPEVRRNRQQARRRAGHLRQLARARGQKFSRLAERFSDDLRHSRDGGDLGLVCRGQLHPALEAVAFAMDPGQVSGVVESPRGFHVLTRYRHDFAQAAEILVSYTGAKRYTPRTPRTREAARTLAEEIMVHLEAGASLEELALAHSDHPNHAKGGFYPLFRKGSGPAQFEEIVFSLEIGGLSGIVETPTGFHIVKRLPVQKIQVRQVEIRFLAPGAEPEGPDGERPPSYREAYRRIHKVHRLSRQPGADFARLAASWSNGRYRYRGGLMEPFGRGRYPHPFEAAAFRLEVGAISDIVETGTGFHLIKRIH